MNKLIGIALAAPLALGLAACGGGDSTSSSTPAASPVQTTAASPADSAAASPAAGSAVEKYCQQVDEYAQKIKELQATPNADTATELQQKAQELQDTAAQLTQELLDDPSQATRVQECTSTLQETLGQ